MTKKPRDSEKEPRRLSLDIPERFKDGDDADEDVTAPKKNNTISMNQSIFSMIARAGQQSQADLVTTQEVDSGDSDGEGKRRQPYHSLDGAARLSRLSSANDFQRRTEESEDDKTGQRKHHRRVLSEHKLLRSLPRLKPRKDVRSEAQVTDQMSSSQLLPLRPSQLESSSIRPSERFSKIKPTASADEDIHVGKQKTSRRRSRQEIIAGTTKSTTPVTLAQRIQQVFEFK